MAERGQAYRRLPAYKTQDDCAFHLSLVYGARDPVDIITRYGPNAVYDAMDLVAEGWLHNLKMEEPAVGLLLFFLRGGQPVWDEDSSVALRRSGPPPAGIGRGRRA